MAVDYDLVVLGGTQEGYEAARYGAQLGARVALVLCGLNGRRSSFQTLGAIWATRAQLPYRQPLDSPHPAWQWAIQRATLVADILTSEESERLMMQGVDVIAEPGELIGDRPLQVTTPSRQLTTRAVLLAMGSMPRLPAIPGLETVPYETAETFLQRETLPQSVAILGSTPIALMLGQILCRWGVTVTLVTPAISLLNQEDPDVSRWITAQLRAEGARLCLGTKVAAIAPTAEEKVTLQFLNSELPNDEPSNSELSNSEPSNSQLSNSEPSNSEPSNSQLSNSRLSNNVVTAETLIVAAVPAPNLTRVNLEALLSLEALLDDKDSVKVNAYLQTPHPRIYACGSLLGGDGMPAIARQEALIAVENALFWNRRSIDYSKIPYDLLTQPEMARVGLTEPQARHRYSKHDLLIHRQPLYDNPKAQWLESTVGFCKIIAHRRGKILGVHGVGPEANEWVQTMALLMAQETPWHRISRHPTLPHSLSEMLRQTTQHWERDRWQPGKWRRDWAENWFNWRRSR